MSPHHSTVSQILCEKAGRKNKTAELVKFDLNGEAADGLIQTIEMYDKKGNMTPLIQINEFINLKGTYQMFHQRDLIDVEEIDRPKRKAI